MKRVVVAAGLSAMFSMHPIPAVAEGPATAGDGVSIVPAGTLHVGDPVPKFKARDIFGAELVFEDLMRAGKKPLLAFWSMYCQACVEKFNAMVAIQTEFAPQGLQVISVNTDGEYQQGVRAVRDFIADYEKKHNVRINFPVLYDERNWLPAAMRIDFLPTIVTVDPQARVLGSYQRFNEGDQAEILAGIEGLVRQMLATWSAAEKPAPGVPGGPAGK